MKNTVIIIPSRLSATRLPNKPIRKILNVEMIVHVFRRAQESELGDVFVATPDKEIIKVVEKNGGKAILTEKKHLNGTSRVFEALLKLKNKNIDLIINLQGDMPNIKPSSISKLEKFMRSSNSNIGTLASFIKDKHELTNPNIVKVKVDEELENDRFLEVKDFFRIKKDTQNEKIYHHIGIYAFTRDALSKYVKLPRSKLELERNLEQMRAMENQLTIKVGLSQSIPLSVDTEKDLQEVEREMN